MIKRQKYGRIAILLILVCTAPLAAQNAWEGTAVVAGYGEFPPGGLYVASNTFPVNSMVSVTNAQTGTTARLIVAKTVDDPGVFMLLSEAAASELGVSGRDTIGVRVEPVQLPGLTSVDPNKDLPYHPDPDVNPAASVGDPNASIIQPDGAEAGEETDVAAAEEPGEETPGDTDDAQPAAPAPPATAPAPAPAPAPSVGIAAQINGDGDEEPPKESTDDAETEPDETAPPPNGEPVDETDFVGNGAVIGAAPTIADEVLEELGEPEISMPRVNPQPQPPLSVALVLPPEDLETGEATTPTAVASVAPVEGDPLAERIAEVESELAREQIAAVPLDMSPVGDVAAPNDGDLGEDAPPLPEVDLTAAFVAEAGPEAPLPPNPVRVVVELPVVAERDAPDELVAPPEPPELAPGEIALPLVPVEGFIEDVDDLRLAATSEPDATDATLPEPGTPTDDGADATERVEEAQPIEPSRIPDDAIVTLEPAEYRSPDPPEPEVDDLEPVQPAEEPEDAAVALTEPDDTADATAETDAVVEEPESEPAVEAEPMRVAVTPQPEPKDDRAWATANLPLIAALEENSAYVQVAAFSNPRSAKVTVDQLGDRFPVAVLSTDQEDRSVYRIVVGPLTEDEKGSALYLIRNRGYRDAFVAR